ncbi:ISWI chromatin-remodeling complex ATPase ISW2 [Neolecta irregularis DAH-3]|uniref:ISWI chromatin-remodeling complex ATPase ISW2 n=1 Tax=Neolecta irregularis (strain DAH-3) TaxID=1198029 RepID=A0A1U7LN64_NEOID|nr:ISWI chromatin-remodeling complex ATPase ISW2 [Neolecta irregularis DAH-3]|eukprot:OLL24079.1 ISWI chromatin-remodeling complex ATPase ISW2 [Neolecta irregularis DAH-3]
MPHAAQNPQDPASDCSRGSHSPDWQLPAPGRRRSDINKEQRRAFGENNSRLNAAKDQDSKKRLAFLLGQSEIFRHFIAEADYNEIMQQRAKNGCKAKTNDTRHGRKTEQEEDAELLQDEQAEPEGNYVFQGSPSFVKGGLMRDYQVQGLNWLVALYENGLNGILADEMGLGKTLQTISFLGYLKFVRNIEGPHLIVVPKSTLDNWKREFEKWVPGFNTLVLQGAKDDRHILINDKLLQNDFDVCITSYEMVLREKSHLRKFAWQYIIIDEAHRIKNEDSMLSQVVRIFNSRNRLLITGTPLQNNLHELWALLNFLLPDVFGDSSAFDSWFEKQGEDSDIVVKQLHKVLRPFLLRRIKADVEKSLLPKKEINLYVGMTDMQVKWYRKILEKDIDAVNGANGKKEGKTRLLNIVMQLRKCCNHPYLFDGAEPGPPYTTDEHLVDNAAKMVVLDKLLRRMKAQGSRILIFSQMSRVLDILEDFCIFRGHNYCRIDGNTAHEDRILAIDDYNKEGSEKFIFLLTTRAGGLGINLTTADIVVLYDSDWNPQADLQAMDRAHRIGQKKQVIVFRFVTDKAIEEKVLERAAQKLRLDQLVIQQGRAQAGAANKAASKDDLLNMIQHGAEDVFKSVEGTMTDDDIDAILRRGEERTAALNKRYEGVGIEDLQKFASDSAYEWNGEDFQKKKIEIGQTWINPAKRERTQNYSIDGYYKDVLKTGGRTQAPPKAPKPKQVNVQDHQFYPRELLELQDKETAWYRKEQGYKVPLTEGDEMDLEVREQDRELEQHEIDNAQPLTQEEIARKEKFSTQGFSNWNRRDFQHFIAANVKHGRADLEMIAAECEGKTYEEIRQYSTVFWKKYKEIDGWERHITQIEAGEEKMRKAERQTKLLRRKLEGYRAPLQQLRLPYSQNKGKVYSEEEDRFLLVMLDKYGLSNEDVYDRLREEIRESPLFRFDWFFKSRTTDEIKRRCQTLLTIITKELGGGDDRKRGADDYDSEDEEPSKKLKNGAKNKFTSKIKGSGQTSRASSVVSTASTRGKARNRSQRRTSDDPDLLHLLQSQLSIDQLHSALESFTLSKDLQLPTPRNAQILSTLSNTILPQFWHLIHTPFTPLQGSVRKCLIDAFSSIAGLGALVSRCSGIISVGLQVEGTTQHGIDLIQFTELVVTNHPLHPAQVSRLISSHKSYVALWKEYVSLISGGKILGKFSELSQLLNYDTWLGNATNYSTWLGKLVHKSFEDSKNDEFIKDVSLMVSRSLGLGKPESFVSAMVSQFSDLESINRILKHLHWTNLMLFLRNLLHIQSSLYLKDCVNPSNPSTDRYSSDADKVGAIASILSSIVNDCKHAQTALEIWFYEKSMSERLPIRRAVALVLSKHDDFEKLCDKLLGLWADPLYMKHAPILSQNVIAENLLLCLAKLPKPILKSLSHQPIYTQGLSDHLSAMHEKVRLFGMVVGEAISSVVDSKPLKFGVPDMQTTEAESLKSLINITDMFFDPSAIFQPIVEEVQQPTTSPIEEALETPSVADPPASMQNLQTEFIPYPIPDFDDEDSDDDPVCATRKKKVLAPVYVKDLISMFRDHENYDRQLTALKSAPSLILRKAHFGSELSEYAIELGHQLVGLKDTFDIDDFLQMKRDAMVILIRCQFEKIGPFFADIYFNGDLSLQQRCMILTAIGIGARELAGLECEALKTLFPTRQLPEEIGKRFINEIDQIALSLQQHTLQPLSQKAEEQVSGPRVLQVRKFSTRLEVEARKPKPTVNKLAQIVHKTFFPLTSLWWTCWRDCQGNGPYFEELLTGVFLKTLSILLHASAPSSRDIPQMTSELWDIILFHRVNSEAGMFSILIILEVNEAKELARHHSKELVESFEWAQDVFNGGQDEEIRRIAASVTVKIQEIMEKYDRLMIEDIVLGTGRTGIGSGRLGLLGL